MSQKLTRLWCLLAMILINLNASAQEDNEAFYNRLINKSYLEIFANPELAIEDYQEGIQVFENAADTLKVIRLLSALADLYAQIADYSSSYDNYWDALILAEKYGNEEAKAGVYSGIGWLYSFYERKETAIKYFNLSLSINKKADESPTRNQMILGNYYALVTLYRKHGDVELAHYYLDSCSSMLHGALDSESNRSFILAERGFVSYKNNKLDQALTQLNKAKVFFEYYDNSFLIILYPFIGDIYKDTGLLDSSEYYYNRSIEISETYKSHLDLIPGIYAQLSDLYRLRGEYKKAYEYMLTSNKLNEIQFGSRSISNQGLLEIKDDFRIEMERQNEIFQQEQLATLEQRNKNKNLQSLILFLSLIFIVLIGILIYRNLTAKFRSEKKLLHQQQEMEAQKNREILEAKNKELTSSALHVIEKEELLAETKNQLLKQKSNPNIEEINKVIKSIDLSTGRSWKEFELRFLQVNREFYKTLQEKHPSLSQNDHKICALIKLNFSSKDMANLLGISVESVHTTRYRLRKKMGMGRKDNLEDYIATL